MIEAASRWVGALGADDRVGVMVLPLPGLNIEFTTDHARVQEALAMVRPLAKPPPPFSYRNVSAWEAIRITEGDTFITAAGVPASVAASPPARTRSGCSRRR